MEVQNRFALRAYGQFPFDAANISFHDLNVLEPSLKTDQYKTKSAEFPAFSTFTSANLTPEADRKTHVQPLPFIVREFKGKQFPGKKLTVGIVGVGEPFPSANSGYVWRDPEKALREILPGLRKKVDIVVLMAYMPIDKTKILLGTCPEVDVAIVGYQTAYQPPVEKIGNAQLVVSSNETRNLGILNVFLDKKGVIANVANRYVMLDGQIPDNLDAAAVVGESRVAIDAARKEMYGH